MGSSSGGSGESSSGSTTESGGGSSGSGSEHSSGGSNGGSSGGSTSSSAGTGSSSGGTPDGGAPDAGYTCPGAGYSCPAGSISVAPDAGLAALVTANPAGTTFCLQPGIHHDSVMLIAGSDGDIFTGPTGSTADGVIENGAELLTRWTSVGIGGTSYWTTDAGAAVQDPDNDNTHCAPGYPACFYPQALYIDGGLFQEVTSLAGLDAGTWYYEMDGLETVQIVTPGSGYAVGDVLGIDGGTSGKVSVTAISDAGGVADASIIHPGYDYPASALETTWETTSWQVPASGPGTGTGCTVQMTAGSGGVRDNVYLAASEAPATATVELGVLPYFLETNVTNDVTVQGLIVEKYAGEFNFAPISMSWSGSRGTASGWHIQNNEARLNNHLGIHVGYGADGGNPAWVRCNWIHDNGQEGMGAGSNGVFVTVEGNTFDHNNAVKTASDYGCGGFKVGAANGMLVDYNIAHDDEGNCVGLWSDVGSQNVTYDHNTVYNEAEGIRVEISSLHTVTNNTVHGCTGQNAGQIVSAQSSQVDIEDNTVTGATGAPGIIVNYGNRNPPVPPPQGMTVAHNSVTVTGPEAAVVLWDFSKPSDLAWEDAGIYDYNTYCVPASWDGGWPSWGKGTGYSWNNYSSWQSSPSAQDPHGTIVTGSCPPPP
jgi:parallel beta-helix repeat protein